MALLVGNALLLVAGANDALLSTGRVVATVCLSPHAFVLYAFAVASTLLFRYHRATGELEQTASSLRERTAELRHSYIELSEMEDELVKQQQLAAVGELAASIAHEVRNPLAVIVNAAASLRRERLSDQDRQTLLGIIDEETSRLNGLVTDLLRFARPFSITSADVELAELLERAARVVGDDYQVELSIPDDPLLGTAAVDPALLRLALENVIENACQAMPDGGTIGISSEYSSLDGVPCVRIAVRDQGPGMDAQVRKRALDPFFTTRRSGTGLGLPIAARIMEAHRGTLTIESEPGSGTVIGLLVPAPEASDHAKPPSRKLRLRRRSG
jgi:signal transduction histidine kinase